MDNLKKVLAIGAAVGVTFCAGGGIAYARKPVEARLGLIEKVYESLPEETQEAYAVSQFLGQDYDVRSEVVKTQVDLLTEHDSMYVAETALNNLAEDSRAATIEMVLEGSSYDVQREVTFYGIPNLNTQDSLLALKGSGETLWTNLREGIEQKIRAYTNGF